MITKINIEDFYNQVNDFVSRDADEVIYTIHDSIRIDYGRADDCNLDWCKENNIPVTKISRKGGCVVNSPGNITFIYKGKIDKEKTFTIYRVLKDFISFLKSKGLNATLNKNDVLVDGYKVASGVCRLQNFKRFLGSMQISINQSLDVIEHACKKKMVKLPKGLADFGLTTEDIENWVVEYFK